MKRMLLVGGVKRKVNDVLIEQLNFSNDFCPTKGKWEACMPRALASLIGNGYLFLDW